MHTPTATKKIHRFLLPAFITPAIGEIVSIDDPRVAHQAHRVLKLQIGESIVVFTDGGPNVTAEITDTTAQTLSIQIKGIETIPPVPRTLIAAISIVKGDHFELMVQKLTEIGVQTIVPIITSRTVKQTVRVDRLQAISDEALEQCGGTARVHITEPLSLKACFENYPYENVILDPLSSEDVVSPSEKVVMYVGPEGGWSEQDAEVIVQHHPQYLRVTQRVLRTETAAILGAYTILWR
ncbi:MAG: ribosomal methyltransferase RsmE [Candidatus Nomurabacteria bacterium]|nr:ribosomal methyltransferase RsmE [Candidatus Nomurabacteria bacterium]